MIRPLTCIALVAALLSAWPRQAEAAESYDNCKGFIDSLPATITSQGVWCLRKDLSTAMTSGNAITIATNNVTIDCNHFKIGGLAAGAGTNARGVHASSRFNVTIRNCSIRGFLYGARLDGPGGGGHLVENNNLDSNTRFGIYVSGAGSTIRNNLVVDTGGSTASLGYAEGIEARDGVDILNNTISGVAPASANANAYGIYTASNGMGSIVGNRIRGLAATGVGHANGIYNHSSGRLIVRDNDLQGPGPGVAGAIGISCADNRATARNNVISGFQTSIQDCLNAGNSVNSN